MSMEVTFLTEEQIWGANALPVLKSYGTKAGMSDLAIVLGGYIGSDKNSDGQRTGNVWSASSNGNGNVRTVSYYGDRYFNRPNNRCDGARPALPSSVTSTIKPSEARLADPSGVWVARQALFSGVQFDRNQRYDGNFANTGMNQYLQNYFAKEIQLGRNVGAPTVVGPSTAALKTQRQRALENPKQGL